MTPAAPGPPSHSLAHLSYLDAIQKSMVGAAIQSTRPPAQPRGTSAASRSVREHPVQIDCRMPGRHLPAKRTKRFSIRYSHGRARTARSGKQQKQTWHDSQRSGNTLPDSGKTDPKCRLAHCSGHPAPSETVLQKTAASALQPSARNTRKPSSKSRFAHWPVGG